jgi:hydroxyethylthiazole kinase-like uncharacterized protein yjeF
VLDADGLNCLVGRSEVLRACRGPLIITPHPGELARLMDVSQGRIVADPWGMAREAARAHRAIVVLKGAHTCIALPPGAGRGHADRTAADGGPYVNIMGNAGMASGGVGDVLTGILGALLAQGVAADAAARLGVLLHAAAGDVAVAYGDPASLVATDLIQALPETFRWLRTKRKPEPQAVARCYYDEANTL